MAGIEKLTAVPLNLPPMQAATVEPKTKWNSETKTAEQQHNSDGVPLWSVTTIFPHDGGLKQMTVTIPAESQPKIEPFQQVSFTNLVARPYGIAQGNGRVNAGLYFTADAVAVAK